MSLLIDLEMTSKHTYMFSQETFTDNSKGNVKRVDQSLIEKKETSQACCA